MEDIKLAEEKSSSEMDQSNQVISSEKTKVPAPVLPPHEIIPDSADKHSSSFRFPFLIILILILIFAASLLMIRNTFQNQLQKSQTANQNLNTNTNSITPESALSMIIKSGTISIGTDATYAPMESTDTKGNSMGYDIDLGNTIAKEMGVKAVFIQTSFDDIFNGLLQKKFDIIMSSVTITDERKQKYGFSAPYLNAGEVIITRKVNTNITLPADLINKKVGVQKNTTEETEAAKYTKLVVSYPDNNPAILDLKLGRIDAVLTDLPNAKGIIDANATLKIASDPFTTDEYGVVFRKEDSTLIQKIDSIINKLSQNGYLTDLKHKWLE